MKNSPHDITLKRVGERNIAADFKGMSRVAPAQQPH